MNAHMVLEPGSGSVSLSLFFLFGIVHQTALEVQVRPWTWIVLVVVVPFGTQNGHIGMSSRATCAGALASSFLAMDVKRSRKASRCFFKVGRRLPLESLEVAAPTRGTDRFEEG